MLKFISTVVVLILGIVFLANEILLKDQSFNSQQQQLRRYLKHEDPRSVQEKKQFPPWYPSFINEENEHLFECDWGNDQSDCLQKSNVINESNNKRKIVVSFAIRDIHLACIDKRVIELRNYAMRVGADFVFIDSPSHPAILDAHETCKDVDPRFYKFWVIKHYLMQYDQVLYLDESMRMTQCVPDLFELEYNRSDLLAAREIVPRVENVKIACEHYGVDCPFPVPMFNSGLMLFNRDPHLVMFKEQPQCDKLERVYGFFDQSFFNALLRKHKFEFVNLNSNYSPELKFNPKWTDKQHVVIQGSQILHWVKDNEQYRKDSPQYPPIIHVTRTGGREYLCLDYYDKCIEHDLKPKRDNLVYHETFKEWF